MRIFRVLSCIFLLAVLAPLPVVAAERMDKLVTVAGEGMVKATPDEAKIRLGVSSQGKTAKAASDANARDMVTVIAAIKASGIDAHDIQTTYLSLHPQYETNKSPPRLTGFQANNEVTVTVKDINRLSAVLDHAIAAGANEMSGVQFVVSERQKLMDKARNEAVADARRKAELYAKAAGMKVGRVMAISEQGVSPAPVFEVMRSSKAAPPIAPGEQTLRAVITVSFELTS